MNVQFFEGRISYKAIKGFRAEKQTNGNYRIFIKLMEESGKISIHPIITTKAEELILTWQGIEAMAFALTGENHSMEI